MSERKRPRQRKLDRTVETIMNQMVTDTSEGVKLLYSFLDLEKFNANMTQRNFRKFCAKLQAMYNLLGQTFMFGVSPNQLVMEDITEELRRTLSFLRFYLPTEKKQVCCRNEEHTKLQQTVTHERKMFTMQSITASWEKKGTTEFDSTHLAWLQEATVAFCIGRREPLDRQRHYLALERLGAGHGHKVNGSVVVAVEGREFEQGKVLQNIDVAIQSCSTTPRIWKKTRQVAVLPANVVDEAKFERVLKVETLAPSVLNMPEASLETAILLYTESKQSFAWCIDAALHM